VDLSVKEIVSELRAGSIPAAIYNDAAIFDLERRRNIGRAWVYLAHESEIPEPGDYVVRWIVDDSFIVIRDEHGDINVLLNVCLHRGMQLCRAELGNCQRSERAEDEQPAVGRRHVPRQGAHLVDRARLRMDVSLGGRPLHPRPDRAIDAGDR
jgi:hypothetical protein